MKNALNGSRLHVVGQYRRIKYAYHLHSSLNRVTPLYYDDISERRAFNLGVK